MTTNYFDCRAFLINSLEDALGNDARAVAQTKGDELLSGLKRLDKAQQLLALLKDEELEFIFEERSQCFIVGTVLNPSQGFPTPR